MKKIANIINFVRSVEPRCDDESYLFPTLKEELELCKQYGWRSTVLFQFDALIRADYRELVASYGDAVETGLWLEVVQPQAEAAGIEWQGEYVWDWRGGVNYLSHYTLEERKRLLDAAFRQYYEFYGAYPPVVGCWSLDSGSVSYLKETYDIKAVCICRDQFGTDFTTLWGGVYNSGYYPCKNNLLCPAQSKAAQIDVPVFRMLGPDPIYQYDMGLGEPERAQGVCTLEPAYRDGGGSERWVRWYLKENYNDKCLSHAYAQFGQENSFGWEAIKAGLPMQFRLLEEKIRAGEIALMTLGETGEWYRAAYETTPPVAMCTDSDWKPDGYCSVWYASQNYRANLLSKDGALWLRDLQLFDERYHVDDPDGGSTNPETGSFNLPVTDGFRFSKNGVRAGIYVEKDGVPAITDAPLESAAAGTDAIRARMGEITVDFLPEKIAFTLPADGTVLRFRYAALPWIPYRAAEEKTLRLAFRGFEQTEYAYTLRLEAGRFLQEDGAIAILPENGKITLRTAHD